MIDRGHALPVLKQCAALGISRGSIYYEPVAVSAGDLALMRRLDELHLEHPHAGSRMLRDLLAAEGSKIGRRHIRTLTQRVGIEAIYCRPSSCAWWQDRSLSAARIDYRSGEPGVVVGHHVHPDGARLPLSRWRHGLVRASHSGLASVDHARCGFLRRRG